MYTFRIKPESELDDYIEFLLNEHPNGMTRKDLRKDHGANTILASTIMGLGRYSDNFTVTRTSVSYTDVTPQTTIIQEQATGAQPISAPAADSEPMEQIHWPEVPMINDTGDYSWFRIPPWYSRMAAMVDAGKHISLAGPPGIGKSSAVEYLAAERSKILVNISADSGLRRRDLTGNTQLINGQTRFDVGEYAAAAVNGWWVKIDEVNAAEPDATMFLNSQIAPPHSVNFYGKSFPVHKDFRLFITYNPGLVGTKPLPDSFKDRFFPIKLQFPNKLELRRMLEANGMPKTGMQEDISVMADNCWTDSIVEFGAQAWEQHVLGRMRYQITPRRLMDAVTLVTIADADVYDALEAAAIDAVDNVAEIRVLKETLTKVKNEVGFSRI